jgi:hypothetical protein
MLLRNLMSTLDHPLVYLSAHTHRGFWAVHRALDRRPAARTERQLAVGLADRLPPHQLRLRRAGQPPAGARAELMPRGDKRAVRSATRT